LDLAKTWKFVPDNKARKLPTPVGVHKANDWHNCRSTNVPEIDLVTATRGGAMRDWLGSLVMIDSVMMHALRGGTV
jgi:hypothetical protein